MAVSIASSADGRGPAWTAMVSARTSASRSGAILFRVVDRIAAFSLRSSASRAAARAGSPAARKADAALVSSSISVAVGACSNADSPPRMRQRLVGGSDTSSTWGNSIRTASRIRSAVRRPVRISRAISSSVSPSALAAMRRASSITMAALSCLTAPTECYVRF